VLLAFFLLLSCRKPEKAGTVTEETVKNMTAIFNIGDGAALKYQEALQASMDSIDAFIAMGKWVIKQPEVEKALVLDQSILEIHYKSGLTSIISVLGTGPGQQRSVRGGGTLIAGESDGEALSLLANFSYGAGDFEIKNKKVLVFNPVCEEFYNNNYSYEKELKEGKHKLDVKIFNNEAADLSVINTFKDYGLILINSHGFPQGFLINNKNFHLTISHRPGAKKYTIEEIREIFREGNGLPLEKFASKELVIVDQLMKEKNQTVYFAKHTLVTYKYIRNLPKLDNAIVFGNYCFSGWTSEGPVKNNVAEAFKSIGAAVYYGYAYKDGFSGPVFNPWAVEMEGFLIKSLLKDGDSTGIAHLLDNKDPQSNSRFFKMSLEFFEMQDILDRGGLVMKRVSGNKEGLEFSHFFSPQYRYGCGTYTDKRDNEVYNLVCIGEQVWFGENLRYNIPGSLAYDNVETIAKTWGRLYNYPMVSAGSGVGSMTAPGYKGICPDSFHVPSEYDWQKLFNKIKAVNPSNLSAQLQAKSVDWLHQSDEPLRNKSGLSFLPGGWAKYATSPTVGMFFFEGGTGTDIWSASLVGGVDPSKYPGTVGVIRISGDTDIGYTNVTFGPGLPGSQNVYKSCRCVRD